MDRTSADQSYRLGKWRVITCLFYARKSLRSICQYQAINEFHVAGTYIYLFVRIEVEQAVKNFTSRNLRSMKVSRAIDLFQWSFLAQITVDFCDKARWIICVQRLALTKWNKWKENPYGQRCLVIAGCKNRVNYNVYCACMDIHLRTNFTCA